MIGIIDEKLFRNAILTENEEIEIDWKKTITESGLTLEQLSEGSGVSEGTLAYWLNETHKPRSGHRALVVGWLLRNHYEVHLI